jgi:superfamily II DNA or RNA helicase
MDLPANNKGSGQKTELDRAKTIAELQQDIEALEYQKRAKEEELKQLQARPSSLLDAVGRPSNRSATLSPKEKVALFLELFGARRDVYPYFWENPVSGKKGYAPACDNHGRAGASGMRFLPLDERAAESHLRGDVALGVYALRSDDSCIFLAADFDGDGWRENVISYKDAAWKTGVAVAIERSRSGNGAHAWIFFAEPVPAAMARRLGTILLAKASALRPSMSLSAYDRLFPNQDTMPKGGFGNLIALPLAGKLRKMGHTVFLDDDMEPCPDQWKFLCAANRLSREDLDRILDRIAPMPAPEPARNDDITIALESEESALDFSRPSIKAGMISGDLNLRFDSRLHIPRAIPTAVQAALKRLATFANPEFHRKLRLRFSTHETPRFIFAGEWLPDRLVLPRGAMDAAVAVIEAAGANVVIQDVRPDGNRMRWTFHGELRPEQEAAVREMAKFDYGVLCAPPGSGKTVMACALIARHRTSALILVHRAVLLDQWRKEAGRFLGIVKCKDIGVWRGATRRLTRKLDIAMLPSLSRVENYAAAFEGYGLVIVDECHHVPAATFEALLKACPCRKIVGLTATPVRKDRLERLLYLQCGPIRHTIRPSANDAAPRIVFVRRSSFSVPNALGPQPRIQLVWDALVADVQRTRQIAGDIRACVEEGRCPLVLSERKAHLDKLQAELATQNAPAEVSVFRLEGGIGRKERQAIREEIDRKFIIGGKFVLLATSSLIGEGYDLPRLDTLFLTMPLSHMGRLIQYVGRLHRQHEDKHEIRVYDYLDSGNALTAAMFRRRSPAYRQMGYRVVMEDGDATMQLELR